MAASEERYVALKRALKEIEDSMSPGQTVLPPLALSGERQAKILDRLMDFLEENDM